MTTTIRFWRHTLWLCAAAGFLTASLQLAVPLHAAQCTKHTHHAHEQCPDSSDVPGHDADNCGVCQFLFGASGKTLPPQITAYTAQPVPLFFETVSSQTLFTARSACRIIPRAPPV